jgi:hypothetical protein
MVIRWKGLAMHRVDEIKASFSYGSLTTVNLLTLTKPVFDCEISDNPLFEMYLHY